MEDEWDIEIFNGDFSRKIHGILNMTGIWVISL
jgi:hypothetical protein